MSNVFISYRREDSAGYAGRLYDRLVQRFGEERVFMDLEIEPGDDFVDTIHRGVGSCQVLLVLVGPRWLIVESSSGGRRLDDPEDFPRIELTAALERGIRVIPVLVGGAKTPSVDQLPAELAPFARRQALELSDVRFSADFDRLVRVIERELAAADIAAAELGSREPDHASGATAPVDPPVERPTGGKVQPAPGVPEIAASAWRIPLGIVGVSVAGGTVMLVATFAIPIDADGIPLMDSRTRTTALLAILAGLLLIARGLALRRTGDRRKAVLYALACLIAGNFAWYCFAVVAVRYTVSQVSWVWLLLAGTLIVAGSLGLAAALSRADTDAALRRHLPFGAVVGMVLVGSVALLPVGRYQESMFSGGDGTSVDGWFALLVGLVSASAASGSMRARVGTPFFLAAFSVAATLGVLMTVVTSFDKSGGPAVIVWPTVAALMAGVDLLSAGRLYRMAGQRTS